MTNENRALHLLFHSETYPGLVKRKKTDVKFILWRNDTLGDYSSWTFFEVDGLCYVRQIVWKQHSTYKLQEPDTYGSESIISKEHLNSILQTISNMTGIKRQLSIDGIGFGIIYQDQCLECWDKTNLEKLESILEMVFQHYILIPPEF